MAVVCYEYYIAVVLLLKRLSERVLCASESLTHDCQLGFRSIQSEVSEDHGEARSIQDLCEENLAKRRVKQDLHKAKKQ